LRFIAGISAYAALIALVIALFTTSGTVAAIAGTAVVGLLVGSYLLERWARRRLVYEPHTRSASRPPRDTHGTRESDRMAVKA
jgi:uncharacterized membrane protein